MASDRLDALPPDDGVPLSGEELQRVLRARWQASYDLQVVQRRGRLYLQVMWAHLEQQSFPLSPEAYAARLQEVAALLNAMGAAPQVRRWLTTAPGKPRLGRALALPLELPAARAAEFLL